MQRRPNNPWHLCVAPMMDWTDRNCRVFHRALAPHARLYTEMVHANAVLRGDRQRLLGFDRREHPVALQLGGSAPAELAQAAAIGAQYGYDEINLNVGCPSERVQAGRFGACLMREPDLVAECVAAMRAAVAIPVTVKCRLGVDDQDEYGDLERFVRALMQADCATFIVHARKAWLRGLSPKENREIPPLIHARAHQLKRDHPGLTIVLNGGLASIAGCVEQLQHVDGVMLGRAAYHTPFVIAEVDRALFAPGTALPDRYELIARLRPYVLDRLAAGEALHHITRHWIGLFQGCPGARSWRRLLTETGVRRDAGWDVVERALDAARAPEREAA